MRLQGKLTSWNDAKGIGTITRNGNSDRVFVHISAFKKKHKRPKEGDVVTYEAEKDESGKFKAINVSFPQKQLNSELAVISKPRSGFFIGIVSAAFIGYLLFCILSGRVQLVVLEVYTLASIIAFATYWIDKNKAVKDKRRIPEDTLHMMALLCGWPGAYAAQRITRHKTVKESFQRVFMITVVLNIAGFIVYSSPTATHALIELLR